MALLAAISSVSWRGEYHAETAAQGNGPISEYQNVKSIIFSFGYLQTRKVDAAWCFKDDPGDHTSSLNLGVIEKADSAAIQRINGIGWIIIPAIDEVRKERVA